MSTTGSGPRIQHYIENVVRYAEERLSPDQEPLFRAFARQYYAHTAPDDMQGRPLEDVYGAAMAHLSYSRHRKPGEPLVRVYSPDQDRHGFASPFTIVEIVNDDMPFLVDSLGNEIARQDLGLHLAIHPVLRVRRTAAGELLEVLPGNGTAGAEHDPDGVRTAAGGSVELAESYVRFEVERQHDPKVIEQIRAGLQKVLADVRAAVEDWPAMRRRAQEIADALDTEAAAVDKADRKEAVQLLRWLDDGHFVFLGYREYELVPDGGDEVLRSVAGSGLGVLRQSGGSHTSHSYARLPEDVRRKAREPNLLNLTKANSRSTVHRRGYLDYIGIKRFDAAGNVVAERRFLGLYTTRVYKQWPYQIPWLRRTVRAVLERAGFPEDSYSGKALVEIIDSYPRDELFQVSEDELYDVAMTILGLQDRQRLRLLVRHDQFGRFVSCLVYLPRERLAPALEARFQEILRLAYHGVHLESTTAVTESVLARLHLVIYTEQGSTPEYGEEEVERQLREAMRSWGDDLHDALMEELGEESGEILHRRYAGSFPAGYLDDVQPRAAVSDIRHLEQLGSKGGFSANLYRPIEWQDGALRLKIFRSGPPITLSGVLPVLENMGMSVVDERPYELWFDDADPVWIYDFGLRYAGALDLDAPGVRDRFHEAFEMAWRGQVENDGFNRLVLRAGLRAREVRVLRTYAKYLRQAGTTFSEEYIAATLVNNPRLARLLVELFRARFDPDADPAEDRTLVSKELVSQIERGLDSVVNLNEDRVIRRLLGTVLATLRTNFFQRQDDGSPKEWLSLKLDSRLVPDLPLPRPMFETFVCSPRMEGIHLRAGRVARGGIRWSDRPEDYRTEILGLMKAQNVKNAVIVPVGAKGGFVLKAPPVGDLDALQSEGIACYRTLVRGLLDLTDNLVGGEVVPPPRVVRHDPDDTYLVVAADKGTATFSDIANALSSDYGFWLGDAFASGGSSGYDHKTMGITAKGAWVSVRRHLRQLGIDPARDGLSAVGIGDMSGDVFGNGMLEEPHLSLIAAFDHRHLFLDPTPDPTAAYAERQRMFSLARSSWADYDLSAISQGGGVFARTAKSVPLSEQVRHALAVDAEALTPDELIQAILKAPVDLLWNGGIGTYVRSSEESNADVGDKTNDAVRIAAADLRCRVVGEGGNLGFTQLGRIEFAARGGRIFTDAIDNSAGVDCSDHEVNIKVLVDRLVGDGSLTHRQRDELLAAMTADVAHLVLCDNDGQTRALDIAAAHSGSMASVHARMMTALERSDRLNREVEFLPSEDEMRARLAAGGALTAPELSVLLAYAKAWIYGELLASDVPDDPFLRPELEAYFPAQLGERFAAQMGQHPLHREIVATALTNATVNRAGMTFVFRLADETGRPPADVVRAYAAALAVFEIGELWREIEGLDDVISGSSQIDLYQEVRTLAERASRWLLRNRPQPLAMADTVAWFAGDVKALSELLPTVLAGPVEAEYQASVETWMKAGVPEVLARRVAGLPALFAGLDIVETSRSTSAGLARTAAVYFALGEMLSLDWLRDRIVALPRDDRWQELARAAMREDLNALRATITAEALRVGSGGDGAEQVRAWFAAGGEASRRCLAVIDEIVGGGRADLATLSVALREIRALA